MSRPSGGGFAPKATTTRDESVMKTKQNMNQKVLLMTVGAGEAGRLEETLFEPLRKSIATSEWAHVVLLPSALTEENARESERRLAGQPVTVSTLPAPGLEDDADACFAHFDGVLAQLMDSGVRPGEIIVDFTRGTKAMSAALVLAAAGRGVPVLRYIAGKRDARGTVVPGEEQVRDLKTARMTFRRDLDLAARFLEAWQFRAAERLPQAEAPDLPAPWLDQAAWLDWLARFWGAWDRLDYGLAARLLDQQPEAPCPVSLSRFQPGAAQAAFIRRRARALPEEPSARAGALRDLAADLVQNGRRRLAQGELEDASLRAYRVLELVGQIRLFAHGQDSGRVDPEWEPYQRWVAYKEEKARKKKTDWRPPEPGEDGRVALARQNVASLLQHMGDPLGADLCNPKKFWNLDPRRRNLSALIHGFEAGARTADAGELAETYDRLEEILLREDPANDARIHAARFPFGPGA